MVAHGRDSLARPAPTGACANMLMNKAQTCSFLGWTTADFSRALANGFPARKVSRSRGADWQIDSREAVAWVAKQAAGEAEPEPADRGEPPPPPRGLEGVDRLENVA